jgi:hypothetical protein
MTRLLAANRTALWGRNNTGIIWQTTVGSPVRFDASRTSGAIQLSTTLDTVLLPLEAEAPNVFFRYEGFASNSVAGNSTPPYMQFRDGSNNTILRIVSPGTISPNFRVQYWNGSGWTTVGSDFPRYGILTVVQMQFVAGSSGAFRVWYGNVLQFEATSIPFNRTGNLVSILHGFDWNGGVNTISLMFASNFDMRGYTFAQDTPNALGAFTDGTGAIGNIGDGNVLTVRNLAAANDRFSGSHPARTLPAGTTIDTVSLSGIIRAGSPAPNGRMLLELGGVQYDTGSNVAGLSTAYSLRTQHFASHPTDGAWTQANYNAINKGVQARA